MAWEAPPDSGNLSGHITGGDATSFQPLTVNFGLFPPLEETCGGGRERSKGYTDRAKADFAAWLEPACVPV